MWLFCQAVVGWLTAAILFVLCLAIGAAPMAGPPDYSIMYFVSVPAALCAAFISRRQRTSRRMLGFAAFSVPVLLVCSWMYYGLATAREARYAALADQWLVIAVITLVAEFVASFVFAANSDRLQEVKP